MSSPFLLSTSLGVPHGFSTRLGGVSEGAYQSLNLRASTGDDPANVEENLARLSRFAQLAPGALHQLSQVHGDRVVQAPLPKGVEADAVWTETPEVAVAVGTADCVPVLLVDPVGRRVAAVHSGWKGTELKIAARTVEALAHAGTQPEDLKACVGPSIRRCCYAVSPALAQRFQDQFGPRVVDPDGAQPKLDLIFAVRAALEGAGVPAAQIEVLPGCTSCDPVRFYSHRRDQGVTGRHLSFAVCRF